MVVSSCLMYMCIAAHRSGPCDGRGAAAQWSREPGHAARAAGLGGFMYAEACMYRLRYPHYRYRQLMGRHDQNCSIFVPK